MLKDTCTLKFFEKVIKKGGGGCEVGFHKFVHKNLKSLCQTHHLGGMEKTKIVLKISNSDIILNYRFSQKFKLLRG